MPNLLHKELTLVKQFEEGAQGSVFLVKHPKKSNAMILKVY